MNAKAALDQEYREYLAYRAQARSSDMPLMGFHDWRMGQTSRYEVPAAEWTDTYIHDAVNARIYARMRGRLEEGDPVMVPVIKVDDAIGLMTEMWHTLSQLKRPLFKLSPEGHYIWGEACWDQRIMCACGDPSCYAAIVPLPEVLAIYADASDESEGSIPFTLPEKYMLVERVKLHEPVQSS